MTEPQYPSYGTRDALRRTFDSAAELYDRARPHYPDAVVDDLLGLGGILAGDSVLEIGCGTGQLSVDLARRGMKLTCVELGAGLAEVARRNLAAFPAATVERGAFEAWPLPDEQFDFVTAATAFHWIDPDVRFRKTAAALRPGGHLGIIATHHVTGGTSDFFVASQDCYERFMPGTPRGLRLPEVSTVSHEAADDMAASGLFEVVGERDHVWDETYSADGYIDVLETYSGHRALELDGRGRLYDCVRELIHERFDGTITKRYLFRITVGRRMP